MATEPLQRLTPKEYLARERVAETKSEYVDGMLVAMSGATRTHILITVNIVREISHQLRGRPSEVYSQDMRVRITEGACRPIPMSSSSAARRSSKMPSLTSCRTQR